MHHYQPRGWQRLVQRIAAIRPVTKFFSLHLAWIDRQIIKWSKGKSSLTSVLTGFPIVTLRTIGAKSGQDRYSPLVGIPLDGKYILIASNWGQLHHPSWYYNLRAHPEAQLLIGGETHEYVAHEATGEEREAYWQRALEIYAGYDAYKQRAGDRLIPVMVLTPKSGGGESHAW